MRIIITRDRAILIVLVSVLLIGGIGYGFAEGPLGHFWHLVYSQSGTGVDTPLEVYAGTLYRFDISFTPTPRMDTGISNVGFHIYTYDGGYTDITLDIWTSGINSTAERPLTYSWEYTAPKDMTLSVHLNGDLSAESIKVYEYVSVFA